jgi:hypothetical protein
VRVGRSSRCAARCQSGCEPFQLFGVFGKTILKPLQMAPHPWNFFSQQRHADQDEDPALDDGQKAADDAEEQEEDAEGYYHAGTDAPDHGGIIANLGRSGERVTMKGGGEVAGK